MKAYTRAIGTIPRLDLKRFKGCILGAAVGDALGAPAEGMNRDQIRSVYGHIENYVINPRRRGLTPGQWTDDTALTLATLESIVEKWQVEIEDIKSKMRAVFQLEPFRGYGPTTRKALSLGGKGQNSVGNGAAMRIAPVALFSCRDFGELREKVVEVSSITHHHPGAVDGALAIAFAIASAAQGKLEPSTLIQQTIDFLGATSEMSYKLREVEDLLGDARVATKEGLEHIGTRGCVLESVGSAFYAFLKTPSDFRESVIQVVNAGGDTDTIGSLAGAMSGAFNGAQSIPRKWLNRLEGKSELAEMSERLYWIVEGQAA